MADASDSGAELPCDTWTSGHDRLAFRCIDLVPGPRGRSYAVQIQPIEPRHLAAKLAT
jgi:hypothetical protein